MFISTKALSSLIKNQYKIRLRVGYIGGDILIIGSEWAVSMDQEYVPNKIKGLIVELAGGLPEKGKLYAVSKDYPNPQFEIVGTGITDLFDDLDDADKSLSISQILLNGTVRLLQTKDPLQSIVAVREDLFELISLSEIDYDIEGQPTGPCYAGDTPYSSLFWYNEIAKVLVMPQKQSDNPLFTLLREVKFDEKLLVSREKE